LAQVAQVLLVPIPEEVLVANRYFPHLLQLVAAAVVLIVVAALQLAALVAVDGMLTIEKVQATHHLQAHLKVTLVVTLVEILLVAVAAVAVAAERPQLA
jgi:hypothetical protein